MPFIPETFVAPQLITVKGLYPPEVATMRDAVTTVHTITVEGEGSDLSYSHTFIDHDSQSPFISLLPHRPTSPASKYPDGIQVKANFKFKSPDPGEPGGTVARGQLILADWSTPFPFTKTYYESVESNTSGAPLTGTFNIPASAIQPGHVYKMTFAGKVTGGGYPSGYTQEVYCNEGGGVHPAHSPLGVYFVGDRKPDQPIIEGPANGITRTWDDPDPANSRFTLDWTRSDPDDRPDTPGGGFNTYHRDDGGHWVQYRLAPSVQDPNPAWQTASLYRNGQYTAHGSSPEGSNGFMVTVLTGDTVLGFPVWQLPAPGTYQMRVRIFDQNAYWPDEPFGFTETGQRLDPEPLEYPWSMSEWSNSIYINVIASFLPPVPLAPINYVSQTPDEVTFKWRFRDPRSTGGTQDRRSIRIRRAGDAAWTEILTNDVSTSEEYVFTNGDGFTIEPGFRYEWQPNTIADPGNWDAEWTSEVASFWAVPTPGSGSVIPVPSLTVPDPGLGCGDNRVFVYARGGLHRLGEITEKVQVKWSRVRDDISEATVQIGGWSDDCGQLLAALRTWQMELVVFRDNGDSGPQRVWEGPITRLTYEKDAVEVAAHDCMAYVYRRILRLGFNDAFQVGGGGLTTVTRRAAWVIQNALSYDDPNMLAYMQVLDLPDDARNSRVVPEYSTTAWALVDDFAAKAGLDYVTVGRKIVLWDTHGPIGLLPEMRDGDFGTPPIVTEYGMQLANYYAVTNNNGVWGAADRFVDGSPEFYGYIEMLSSAYGESDAAASAEVLTPEARLELEATLTEQASRNIAARYPAPLVARVPDNSTLNPELSVGINQLIPGVHVPLRSDSTLRPVTQMQKLDRIEVTQNDKGEQVTATLSPAPRSREADPDAEGGEEA